MRPDEQAYIERAIEEVRNPSLAVTKHFLEVLELETEGGSPKIARVAKLDSEAASVWFHVKDEPFFLIVTVAKKASLEIHWTYTEASNDVYLTAISDRLSFAELAELTTLRPLQGWSKGDRRRIGDSVHTFSRVFYKPVESNAYELEEKISLVLTELERDADGVRRLLEEADGCLQVRRDQYINGNAGTHIDLKTIRRLSALGLALDIDMGICVEPLRSSDSQDQS